MRPLAATGWLVALGWLLVACSSGQEGTVPGIASAHAEREVVDGEAQLASGIEVRFDRSIVLAPAKVPLASNFEVDVPTPGGSSRRVLVKTAELDASNPRAVKLQVEAVVPDGATVRIAERAFKSGANGELKVTVEGDLSPALAVLASQPLYLSKPDIVQTSQLAEVKDSDRDPAAMREALAASLQKRGADEPTRTRALERYDGLSADIAPSPKIRAAIAGLTGTFAEPAIDAIFTANNCTGKPAARVVFQPPPNAPELIARVTFTRSGQRVISLNPITEGERIDHLMSILAHEAIHCDDQDGITEEIAATAFDAFLYLQLVGTDPSLVTTGTLLAKELNVDAISLLNSGRRLPESVGVLPSVGVPRVLPNTNVRYASFAELVSAAYPGIDTNPSPQEPLAQAYVNNLLAASGMTAGNAFNLRYLDELLGRSVTPAQLAAAIQAFGLQVPS